jgi:hypothetical protein
MTTEEIYKLASEITEKEFNNVFNKFTAKEVECFNSLVQLGDTKELALFTVIAQKYLNDSINDCYIKSL